MPLVVVALGLACAVEMYAVQAPAAVGWRFQVMADASRAYEPDAGDLAGPGLRPVALTVFYPASPGAAPLPGTHPLILFAHSSPLGMVAMSEDLASHGMVVAGVLSRGAERGAYRLSVGDVQAMGEDLRFALEQVRKLPFVDASRLGVIGMSNGAFGAVALANATRVQAIVSLDGTVGEGRPRGSCPS